MLYGLKAGFEFCSWVFLLLCWALGVGFGAYDCGDCVMVWLVVWLCF